MNLQIERVAFSVDIAKLVLYAKERGYGLALDEGRVMKTRKGQPLNPELKPVGSECRFQDHVHSNNSTHYVGLGQDVVLYVDGKYVSGPHAAWKDLSDYWKKLSVQNTWGGDFKTGAIGDFNHFSRGER